MGTRAERHMLALKARRLGEAKTCLQGYQQQDMVPPAYPGALVRRIQEGIDLRACQEVDQLAIEPLGRHGEDALYLGAVCRHFIGGEAEERPDCGEAQIAGSDG